MGSNADDARTRLGALIAKRRKELPLSVNAAAQAAGIDRGTWNGLERATRQTEDYTYVRVERVLGWAPGSIEIVLAGGEPELLVGGRSTTNGRTRTPRSSEQMIKDIWSDPIMGQEEKEALISMITRAEAERTAAERAAALKLAAVEDRLRESRERRRASGE